MQNAGGTENAWISAEDDDGEDRLFWRCPSCPLSETCNKSRNSFKNAALWSYVSEEQCREYVKRHLL